MDTGELPTWTTTATILGTIFGSSVVAIWTGRKSKPEGALTTGTAEVVTASFVDKAALDKNTAAIVSMNDQLSELNQHMRAAEQFRHDERIAKDAAAHALLEARLGGKS